METARERGRGNGGARVLLACLVALGALRVHLRAALVAGGLAISILIPEGAFADLAFLIGLLALAGLPVTAGMAILSTDSTT